MGEQYRKDDIVIEVLAQQFRDFVEYDKERWKKYDDKYEADQKHTRNWRDTHWEIMQEHSRLLNEIVPNYRRGLWALTIIVAGSIAIGVQSFWNNIRWK